MNSNHAFHETARKLINTRLPSGAYEKVSVRQMREALTGAPALIVNEWVSEISRRAFVRGEPA